MRVALVSYEYPPHFNGGIGNYTRQAALMLQRRGHDVSVFGGCPDRSYDDVREGVAVHYGECNDRWQFAPVAAEMFSREHSREPFDVVEAPELASEGREIFRRFPDVPSVVRLHTPSYLAAWVDREAFGKCAVFLQSARYGLAELARGRFPRNGINFWRGYSSLKSSYNPDADDECQTAKMADVLVSPSERLARDVARDWQLPVDTIQVVANVYAPTADVLNCVAPPRCEVSKVCFYGGVKAFKGVDVLAGAIPLVLRRHPGLRFAFAGSSQVSPVRDMSVRGFIRGAICGWEDMETWLRRKLAPLGDAVEFLGLLDRPGLGTLLNDADLCVFPSRYDNFPNTCLEAMAAGRPIVATTSGGMEDMLASGRAGLLVSPGNARDLAAAICRMIKDGSLRQAMARCARERVLRIYGDEALAPEYERLYTEAIRRADAANAGTGAPGSPL